MTPTARRRLAPEIRRRQVLDAAIAVFSEEGLHGASMDAIAARAGVSKPSVYAHGGTKGELFAACLAREAERLMTAMTTAVGSGAREAGPDDAEARLFRALRAFFHAVTTHRQGWTVLYRQASTGEFAAPVDVARRSIVMQAAELLADELGGSVEAAAPVAHTLVGAAEGLTDWWLGGGDAAERSSTIDRGDAAERSSTIDRGDAAERSSTIDRGDAAERSSTIGADRPPGDEAPADVLARTLTAIVWPGLDRLRRELAP